MRLYTIRNDFHNTTATILCEGLSHFPGECTIRPTKRQIARAKRNLCGITGCTCGDTIGARGTQRTDDGKRLIVDCSAFFD